LKARVPNLLLPRRKYELNEDLWIVRFAWPKIEMAKEIEWAAMTVGWHVASTTASRFVTELRNSAPVWRSVGRGFAHQGGNIVLFFQWGRIPKDWERAFVLKIRESESKGVPFHDIVKATLPSVIGEGPSFVLLRWVGKNGAKGPRQFVKTVEKMFGKSAKSVIVRLNNSLDPDAMLQVPEEPEEKFRAVIEEIERVDAEKSSRAAYQEEAIQENLAS